MCQLFDGTERPLTDHDFLVAEARRKINDAAMSGVRTHEAILRPVAWQETCNFGHRQSATRLREFRFRAAAGREV